MELDDHSPLMTLEHGEGTIGSEHTPEVIQRAEAIARGVYHTFTEGTIICKCIDGRNCRNPIEGPNSAGGTLSLLVADDLTSQRYIATDEPIITGMERLVGDLKNAEQPIGVHSDSHASGENSGCGANDKLPLIYAMMVNKAEHIRELAQAILGYEIPQQTHDMIQARASERVLFSPGAEVREVVTMTAADMASETLQGPHKEIIAIINKVTGTTLDRDALEDDSEGEHQAFNVDAWAFEASARLISQNDEDGIDEKIIALTYYNLATALVLCGPNMLVSIRS